MSAPSPKSRPAEFAGGVAGAASYLICRALGVDDPVTLGAVTVVVGFIPAAVTWTVTKFRKPSP